MISVKYKFYYFQIYNIYLFSLFSCYTQSTCTHITKPIQRVYVCCLSICLRSTNHNSHKKCTPSLKINNSYSILCPQIVNKDPIKVEKAAQLILDFIQLPDDQYRLGKTKVHPRNIKRILFN